jgi:hypothetical protein
VPDGVRLGRWQANGLKAHVIWIGHEQDISRAKLGVFERGTPQAVPRAGSRGNGPHMHKKAQAAFKGVYIIISISCMGTYLADWGSGVQISPLQPLIQKRNLRFSEPERDRDSLSWLHCGFKILSSFERW